MPLKNASGVYEGHEWFVYERVSKPLSDVATSNTLKVSRDDEINIAVQILEILQFLFAQNKVLKNLDVHDFFLRRTTKGYRVILLNQDFYTKWGVCMCAHELEKASRSKTRRTHRLP